MREKTNLQPVKKKHCLLRIGISIAVVLIILILAFVLYSVFATYLADAAAHAALISTDTVRVEKGRDSSIAFIPNDPVRGLIFYPGGLVDQEAYAPLMQRFAQDGTLCVLLRMPLNLAILSGNAADGVQKDHPQIQDWYIGGHSLGGLMASGYAAAHADEYKGLLLLGAYTTSDISASCLKVACIYGSEDGVMNKSNYQAGLSLLPVNTQDTILLGGNHAGFGSYGAQKGDGEAALSQSEQWDLTAEAFLRLVTE